MFLRLLSFYKYILINPSKQANCFHYLFSHMHTHYNGKLAATHANSTLATYIPCTSLWMNLKEVKCCLTKNLRPNFNHYLWSLFKINLFLLHRLFSDFCKKWIDFKQKAFSNKIPTFWFSCCILKPQNFGAIFLNSKKCVWIMLLQFLK